MDKTTEGLERRPKGRRPLPRKKRTISVSISLYPHQLAYLDRNRNISGRIQEMVDEALADEEAQRRDDGAEEVP